MEKQNNQVLEQYIYKLYQLQMEKRQNLTKQKLIEVATEMGLSENELKEIEQDASRHIERAHSFLSSKRFDSAEIEFNAALELCPLHEEFIIQKAQMYVQWYKTDSKRSYLNEAEALAKRCLEITPNFATAIHLLNELDTIKRKKRRKRRWIFILSTMFFSLLTLFILFVLSQQGFFIKPHGMEGAKYKIPVAVEESEFTKGIVFQFNDAAIEHDEYKGSTYFDLEIAGKVIADSIEIRELMMNGVFLDTQGEVVAEQVFWFVHPDDFVLRPADCVYFNPSDFWSVTNFNDRNVRKIARLVLKSEKVTTYLAADFYADGDKIPTLWLQKKPSHLAFEIAIRSNRVGVLHESDRSTEHDLVLELKHTGKEICRELVVNISWFDKKKVELGNHDYTVFDFNAPPLEPQQTVIFHINEHFYEDEWSYPVPFYSYKVKIRSAK